MSISFLQLKNLIESFYAKAFIKIMMFIGIFLTLYYWSNPNSYAVKIGSCFWLYFTLSFPIIEISIQLLLLHLPPQKLVPEQPLISILGPFLCRPSINSMGFWMSFWDNPTSVTVSIYKDDLLIETISLTPRNDTYSIWMGESSPILQSDNRYTYSVHVDGEKYTPDWNAEFKFSTFSENSESQVNFVNMSCHGVREWELENSPSTTWAMWTDLKNRHANSPISFAILGGDQVYMDSQFENHIKAYDKIPKTDRINLIKSVYYDYWSAHQYQSLLCQIPTFLMWDDHDIIDGFGSRPDSYQNGELKKTWALFKEDLEEAFFAFQAIRNPDTNCKRKNYTYTVNLAQFSILGLDLRNERNVSKKILLSKESKDSIEKTLLTIPKSNPLFIVSPVTVTRISGPIEELLGQLSNAVWRYTRWLGHGKAFKKVLLWQLLFFLSFLCLQIKDSHLSNFLSSLFLFLIAAYMISKFYWRTYKTKQESEIEGNPLVVTKIIMWILLILGIGGSFFEWNLAPISASDIVAELKRHLSVEAHNLVWLFGLQSLGLLLVFDANKLKKSTIPKNLGLFFLLSSIILILWHGLPDNYVQINLILFKIPLAIMSFFYLLVTILECLGAVDEIAGLDDDIKDSWSSLPNTKELSWLFSVIKKLDQRVFILCGDIHTGGLSNIRLGNKNIPQITNSPITYPPMPPLVEKITSGLKKMPLPKHNPQAIAENYFFISKRNYGIVSIKKDEATATFIYEDMSTPIKVELQT